METLSPPEMRVLRAVEAFFNEQNVTFIDSLRNAILKSPDGMLPLASVCSSSYVSSSMDLKDVKPHQLSQDLLQAIAEILRVSPDLKVSQDGKRVGMATPLSDFYKTLIPLDDRSLIVYPLAADVESRFLFEFFSMHAEVSQVKTAPHVADEELLGTALVEFVKAEDASRISKNRRLKFGQAVLELKPKKVFESLWAKLVEFKKIKSQSGISNKSNSNFELSYPKGLIVAFTLKWPDDSVYNPKEEMVINQQDGQTPSQDNKDAVSLEDLKCALQKFKGVKDAINQQHDQLHGQDNKYSVLLEDLESVLQKFGAVKYVDFKSGSESGYILFEDAVASQNALQAANNSYEGGVAVKNCVAILHPVTGEAEKEFWRLIPVNQDVHCNDYKGRDSIGGGMEEEGLKNHQLGDRGRKRSRADDAKTCG